MTGSKLSCDVLVLGAGPAGLAAAAAARKAGAEVVCVDLFAQPGGQYHMQPPADEGKFSRTAQVREGRQAADKCRELGVHFLLQTEVFWVEPAFTVFGSQAGNPVAIRASALVVASGAMERTLPFPGWTLPGVMTPGGAQRLIKASNAIPGRNVVLAGTGPFLLAVASSFATAGLKLNAWVEMRRPSLSALALLLRHPGRLVEAVKLLQGLRRTGARRLAGHRVVEAIGDDRLEAVRIAPADNMGRPDLQAAFTLDGIDLLCVGYGFRPVIDVTSLLQAEHYFDDALGGWCCKVDWRQATSVPGLFAAGETTGIGGAVPARLSGQIAGTHAAIACGHANTNPAELARAEARLKKARRFAAGLARLFPFPGHLVGELAESELICRCEDVSIGEIDAALAEGADGSFGVKMWTRAGMGPCQGRICGPALAERVAMQMGRKVCEAGYNRPHLPLRPVPLSVVDAALALAESEP